MTIGERLLVFEKCPDAFGNDPRVQNILVRIHLNILQFLGKSLHIFRRRAAVQVCKLLSPKFDKNVQGILSELERDERTLLAIINAAQTQRALEFYGRVDLELKEATTHRLMTSRQMLMTARQMLKQILAPAVFLDDKLNEARKILTKFPMSGQWLLQHADFLVWAENNKTPSTQVLVLDGIPGAGKTILSYIAFDSLLNQAGGNSRYKVHHLRLTERPHQNNNCLGAMQSLLYEVSSQNLEEIQPIIDSLRQIQGLEREHIIEQNLSNIMASNDPTFLFIDGLDELNDFEIQKILEILGTLLKQFSGLRVFFSCRMQGRIKAIISAWDHVSIPITGSLLHNDNDIQQFVHHSDNIKVLTSDYKFNFTQARAYLDAVCTKAEGMFLYAKLVLAELKFQSCDKRRVEDLIQELPDSLDGAYQRSLERVSKLHKNLCLRANRVFQLLVAQQPLQETDLKQAVVDSFNESFIPNMELRQSLFALCGPLVEVNSDGIVTLVHSTLKRYFLDVNDLMAKRDDLVAQKSEVLAKKDGLITETNALALKIKDLETENNNLMEKQREMEIRKFELEKENKGLLKGFWYHQRESFRSLGSEKRKRIKEAKRQELLAGLGATPSVAEENFA
ncbi:hypothetical protein TWF694_008202 [Orbilia ellipsospora]|uniref:Nephrocystin 3-like N-terminal domain-containing protein n=1 Tax=Orbilia ellipsospora TaxID=2528407 RepID=A0AAV9XM21_9PEZI